MVGYILTDYSEYPFLEEGWIDHFKKDYCSRIIYGFLNKESFLKKLQATFDMTDIAIDSLPGDINRRFFGCDHIENYTGLGRDPAKYEETAWLIKGNDKSSVFSRFKKEKQRLMDTTSLYPAILDPSEGIYLICSKNEEGFTSNNDLMSAFLIWYRGMTDKTSYHSAYDQSYLGALHFMLQDLSAVFGKHRYIRMLKNPLDHRTFL